MKCIEQNKIITEEIIIKKSRFIGYLKYVSSEEEAKNFIKEIKEKHSDARHNCSAYIIGITKKRDDDGEPSATAGQPILDVLEYNEVNNVCAVVTRYFGGIKLGAGGLVRAYSKATKFTLDQANLVDLKKGYNVKISFNYTNVKILDYLFNSQNISILNKSFENKISYEFAILEEDFENIKKEIHKIDHTIDINIISNTYLAI